MILHSCIQGTQEWAALRAGMPTASCFDQIMTPKTRKPTERRTRYKYMHTLLAERLMGHPVIDFQSSWMDRGKRLEAEAVLHYEATHNVTTVSIGFVTNDAGTIGASPDRFVGDDGGLEVKAPREHTHVGYMLIGDAKDTEYYAQIQGAIWICERDWWDFISYHPEMPRVEMRVFRDEDFIADLSEHLERFCGELETFWTQLRGDPLMVVNDV